MESGWLTKRIDNTTKNFDNITSIFHTHYSRAREEIEKYVGRKIKDRFGDVEIIFGEPSLADGIIEISYKMIKE